MKKEGYNTGLYGQKKKAVENTKSIVSKQQRYVNPGRNAGIGPWHKLVYRTELRARMRLYWGLEVRVSMSLQWPTYFVDTSARIWG